MATFELVVQAAPAFELTSTVFELAMPSAPTGGGTGGGGSDAYTPAVPADYDGTPVTKDAALDELAARLRTLEGTAATQAELAAVAGDLATVAGVASGAAATATAAAAAATAAADRLDIIEAYNYLLILDDGEALPAWMRTTPQTLVTRRPPP